MPLRRAENAVHPGAFAPQSARDRRTLKRHLTVFKVARLHAGGADDLCLIRNISSSGMMIESGFPLTTGQRVTIEIRSDRLIAGVIRWARPGAAGMEFDVAVDVAEVLGGTIDPEADENPRAPRFERTGIALIQTSSVTVTAPIANISLSGLCINSTADFRKMEMAAIHIEGLCSTHGQIRWVRSDSVGIQFDRPLPFRQFEQWLLDQLPKEA